MDKNEKEFITEEFTTKLKNLLRMVPNFPKEGINFQDISTLLVNEEGFRLSMDAMVCHFKNEKIDKIAGKKKLKKNL